MMISCPFFAREAKFSPDLPQTITSTNVVSVAVALIAVEELVVGDRGRREQNARIGFSQGWARNQIGANDDVLDVHNSISWLFEWPSFAFAPLLSSRNLLDSVLERKSEREAIFVSKTET
jgi:hypothetical protein